MPPSRHSGAIVCCLAVLVAFLSACHAEREAPRETVGLDVLLEPELRTLAGRVPRNATLDGLLRGHQLGADLALQIVDVARDVFNPRLLRAGQPYELIVTLEGWFRRFEYEIDADRFLRIVNGERPAEPLALKAEILMFPKRRVLVRASGTIDREATSLVASMNRAGEDVTLALSLADVLGAQVDFNADLQRGDRFDVLVEKRYREEQFAGYGPITVAELVNGGRRLQAFRFGGPDGRAGYYDEHGNSVRRFFLSSPLPFTPRITSRFSRSRMHPVLGIPRAHLGVDYAAPTGTPVRAVADGTVVSASFDRSSGRMVRLRHTNGYDSYYLHLSAFADGIRRGAEVAQGQTIGRVGATGLVTGPHLDYRLSKNGAFVDPRSEHRKLPPGEPIPASMLAAFEAARDEALRQLAAKTPQLLAGAAIGQPLLPRP